MNPTLSHSSDVPESVRQAFAERPHLTMPELSKASRMDPKTLRRHIDAGRLNWRNIGTGSVRVRRGLRLGRRREFLPLHQARRHAVSVYRHRNSPYWQFDFQRAGYRFCGSTEVPKTKPKREAEVFEAQERRAAERLIEEVRRSGRQPMTFAAAADRWWNEVGQHSAETDLQWRPGMAQGSDRPNQAPTFGWQ